MITTYEKFKFVESKGLYFEETLLIDANVQVVQKKYSVSEETEKTITYLVRATYIDGRPSTEKWFQNLKNIDFWKFEINDALLNSEKYNLLIFKLLYEAQRLNAKIYLEDISGINVIEQKHVFFWGQHVLLPHNEKIENLVFKSCLRLNVDNEFETKSVTSCLEMLPGVSELMFYGSLYAIVKPFLNEVEIEGGFVNALVGPAGHLKTSLVRKYALWLENKVMQELGFHISIRNQTLLEMIEKMSGQNYLLDDLHPMPNRNDHIKQQQRLEAIVRHVNLKKTCANLFVTGESLADMGIFSCIDRTLQITIPSMSIVEIEGLKSRMSNLPDYFMRNIAFIFAKRLMQNYNQVLVDIEAFYERNKNATTQNSGYATRIHRYALFYKLTRFLFCKYCNDFERGENDKEAFENALETQLAIQDKELQYIAKSEELARNRKKEEQSDYAMALFEIINKEESITLIHDVSQYFCHESTCCMKDGRVYFTSKALEYAFMRHYERHISIKDVVCQLQKQGILETEPGSRGKQKNFKSKKHYVISMRVLLYYLHSQNYSLSEELLKLFGVQVKR